MRILRRRHFPTTVARLRSPVLAIPSTTTRPPPFAVTQGSWPPPPPPGRDFRSPFCNPSRARIDHGRRSTIMCAARAVQSADLGRRRRTGTDRRTVFPPRWGSVGRCAAPPDSAHCRQRSWAAGRVTCTVLQRPYTLQHCVRPYIIQL